MGTGITKRRRTGTDSSFNSSTPSRPKSGTGRGRGRPPNAPRDGRERPPPIAECFKRRCNDVLDRLIKKDYYNIFLEPVNTNDVAGYLDVIKQPMDFTTMRTKLTQQVYKSLGEFRKDLDLIWSNCLLFNGKEPTNVFSKKAIELRRLTEKLIVNTRKELERDKEILHRWKEKHRKRRETMAANAANATAKRLGTSMVIPSPSIVNQDNHVRHGQEGRDPMLSTEFTPQDHNGRTPEQNALAESLRLQYFGTTGLYRKGMQNAPYPQYTKPDGSIVHIPLIRYDPSDDHWSAHDPQSVDLYRINAAPQLYCDALPPSRAYNPCRPQPNVDSVLVGDYAQSLYDFVRGNDKVATELVTELLSPELVLKAQHDELGKQGLSMKEIAKRIKADRLKQKLSTPQYQPTQKWDAEAIISLADDIEKINKTKLPLLPRLARAINELDGIKGLDNFLNKDLVKEVNEVPVEVIDFGMPHGVSLATLSEILKLAMAPALQLPANSIRCIENLRRTAQDYASRRPPGAKLTGPAVLSPAQLHEVQLRAQAQKRHRRVEAERQARLIADHYRHVSTSNNMQARPQMKDAAPPYQRTGDERKSEPKISTGVNIHAAAAAAQRAAVQGRASQPLSQSVTNQLRAAREDSKCQNCGARETLGTYTGLTLEGVQRLCNACGVYWQKTQRHRPRELWSQALGLAQQPTGSPLSGRTPARGQPQSRTLTPAGSPGGVSRPSIQKRTPQSSSRRSPSSGASRRRTPRGRTPTGATIEQSNLPQGLQHMPGLPNSIHTAAQRIQDHQNASLQGIAGRQLPVPASNLLSTPSTQTPQERGQRSNQIPYPGNLQAVRNLSAPISLGISNSLGSAVYPGQKVGGLPMQHQFSNIHAAASTGFLPHQKHDIAQMGTPHASAQAPSLVHDSGSVRTGDHAMPLKNPSLVHSSNGISKPNVTAQVPPSGLGRPVQLGACKIAPDVQLAQLDRLASIPQQNVLARAPGDAEGIGFSPYAAQSSNMTTSNIPGFENGNGHSIANGGVANNVPGNSDQMMESLLFGDGGITGPSAAAPDFDF